MLIRHRANTRGRDFFVGDLHGQYRLLEQALADVQFNGDADRLFAVGDLIDRGVSSLECLALVDEPWFFSVMGNHEQLAKAALCDGSSRAWGLWLLNGGSWALRRGLGEARRRLEIALQHLPYAREVEVQGKRIGIVHADPPDDWGQIEQADTERLLWGRERIARGDQTPVAGIDMVVVGHSIIDAPQTLGNVYYIDTGAFHTGRLTLVEAGELVTRCRQ
ncbi:metallophosphoesterase [Halomonas campisalis]|uniref:Metallophosphoesterase n=1 Tax=Billgrantia campisalis TaxID=74661 RepID=A0ABS9P5V7_9GAMM|nr:metallophosphoesterase [Halomonas campisalis]MCG6657160.1 metallophosphoesterase [Halomonas campisalis]MDR5862345.1 metallophosphoesterase [Halomonas campisalis]